MRGTICVSWVLLTAACAGSTELGSTEQSVCHCTVDPNMCCCNSPILIDVAGNGLELTSLDDGVAIATRAGYERTDRAWTEPGSDDAWLVLDRNRDGVISDMSEMFGNTTPQAPPPEGERRNGFLALMGSDDNADAMIDEHDLIFGALRLWQDKNHDGVSQPDELHGLVDLGVASISLTYSESRRGDDHGNLFLYRASVYGTPGSTVGKDAWDVWLTGVQSMPIKSAPAAPIFTPGIWTCDARCLSIQEECPELLASYADGNDPAVVEAEALQLCHDAVDPAYCVVDPFEDSTTCTQNPSGPPWTCTATCASQRNNVPYYCPGSLWYTASDPTLEEAQRRAIEWCTTDADSGYCMLADDPFDTPADSPDHVIDDVAVICRYEGPPPPQGDWCQ